MVLFTSKVQASIVYIEISPPFESSDSKAYEITDVNRNHIGLLYVKCMKLNVQHTRVIVEDILCAILPNTVE